MLVTRKQAEPQTVASVACNPEVLVWSRASDMQAKSSFAAPAFGKNKGSDLGVYAKALQGLGPTGAV